MYRENKVNSFALNTARALKLAAALTLVTVLTACSGGGAPTTENPVTAAPGTKAYNGVPAQNADVLSFQNELWVNISGADRCGGCHNATGQSPQFARADDINLAYQAANTVVNLTDPASSRMVQKVGGGHNCWLGAASACADTLTVWIRKWAGAAASGGKQIELKEPEIKEVGASKSFPTSSAQFQASLLWNDPSNPPGLLRKYCSRCHAPTAAVPVQPFFASSDPDEAYAAVRSKINLDNPAASRLVVRLRTEFHNCWSDCATNSNTMEAAVRSFTDSLPITQVDPSLVTSKALTLYDGTVAAGGNRYENYQIALYEFKTGKDDIAYDTSGVEPALNLKLSSSDMWVGGWGINIKAGQKAQGSTTASKKLADLIKSTGEFTVEAWMAPANVTQEDAYAVTYSAGVMARNFTLGQRAYQYEARTRTTETDANGTPTLLTAAADRDAQASLQHVVLTYDPINGRRLYVNGKATGDVDPRGGGGSLSDWDDSFALVLGAETSGGRQWTGVMRLVAIHNRALSLEQIQQNFAAGVGERYFLLFSVSHLIDIPKSYVMFEVSEYDSYAYLFNKPTFISLEPNVSVSNFDLSGVRVGVNGSEARVGQTYIPLAVGVGGGNYTAGSGQLLSMGGAVIPRDKGPMDDVFFLTFEKIGTHTHTVTEPPPVASPPADIDMAPKYGMRTFDQINESFSKLTGVPLTTPSVVTTFNNVKQQMPSVPSIDSFLGSHQTGIAQLAIAYCNAMVSTQSYRDDFFGPGQVNPGLSGSIYDGGGGAGARATVITKIFDNFVGNVQTQATQTQVSNELNTLMDALADNNAAAGGAGKVVVGACSAVLGSAAVTLL